MKDSVFRMSHDWYCELPVHASHMLIDRFMSRILASNGGLPVPIILDRLYSLPLNKGPIVGSRCTGFG
jgi:hypothetical protein